jgi:hypothetical protein
MEQNLTNIDEVFCNQYKGLLEIQKNIQSKLQDYKFDISKCEITDAIINRMNAFWAFHYFNKDVIERKTTTSAADFFTETCLFFIKAFFKNKYEVRSEVNILKEKIGHKALKPDISIWKGEILIAVIEIKLSNGFKGKHIIPHLEDRENKIKELYPNIFFGVIAFWNFFDISSEKCKNFQYIGIKTFKDELSHPKTGARVESMLKIIESYK